MKEQLRRTAVISIITSIVFAILGIIMILNPETTIEIVSSIIGLIIIVIGAERIVKYFAFRGDIDFFNNDVIYGIIAVLFGILIMTHSNTFVSVVRIVIGIWIAYSALTKINFALKLKKVQIKTWTLVFTLSTISLIAGILIMFTNTVSIVVMTAIVMIIYAISDIIDEIILIRNIDRVLK